jgi:hypothetical protein
MNIEQEILAIAAKQVADQIDIDLLKSLGVRRNIEFVCSTGTVYGVLYYTVEPKNLEWHASRKMWDDMMLWCRGQFGETGSLWKESKNLSHEPNRRWYANNSKFWFQNQKDQSWFLLKWG